MTGKPIKKTDNEIVDRLFGVEKRLSDLEESLESIRWNARETRGEIQALGKSFIKFEDKFGTEFEKFRSKMYTMVNPLFGQLKKFNEEQTIPAGQHQETYEKIQKLEKIHPKFSHAAI